MADWSRISEIFVSCPKYFPQVLSGEIKALGFGPVTEVMNGVRFKGSLTDCLKLNLWLRTAHHVYWKIDEAPVLDAENLYAWIRRQPWEEFLSSNETLSIVAAVHNDTIRDNRYAGLKVKDAIVDRLREKTGSRPDTGSEKSGAVVFLHWEDDRAAVFLDTTGDPLSKRGYRLEPGTAPMRETLCAAVLLLAGWNGQAAFVNPMCGSGTLAIEAALIAARKAPSVDRLHFSFMALNGFQNADWHALVREARAGERKPEFPIFASDIDIRISSYAKNNAKRAGVADYITVEAADYRRCTVPEGTAMVVINPEYGQRMGDFDRLHQVYKELGDWIKHLGAGKTAFVFAAQSDLLKSLGLKPDARVPFLNANIECRWLSFPIRTATEEASTVFRTKYPEYAGK